MSDPPDDVMIEGIDAVTDSLLPATSVAGQLTDHGVVEHRDLGTLDNSFSSVIILIIIAVIISISHYHHCHHYHCHVPSLPPLCPSRT